MFLLITYLFGFYFCFHMTPITMEIINGPILCFFFSSSLYTLYLICMCIDRAYTICIILFLVATLFKKEKKTWENTLNMIHSTYSTT